jgi:hypothetical protein
MPGTVSVSNAQGSPTIPQDADFGICFIGYSTTTPLAAGVVSPPYSSPSAFAGDFGLSDAIDGGCQAITVRPTNPQPSPICFYRTPATTPGARGTTLTTTGVTGTSVVTKTGSTNPVGTYQPVGRVITGCTLGVTGGVIQYSPDNGRSWLPPASARHGDHAEDADQRHRHRRAVQLRGRNARRRRHVERIAHDTADLGRPRPPHRGPARDRCVPGDRAEREFVRPPRHYGARRLGRLRDAHRGAQLPRAVQQAPRAGRPLSRPDVGRDRRAVHHRVPGLRRGEPRRSDRRRRRQRLAHRRVPQLPLLPIGAPRSDRALAVGER